MEDPQDPAIFASLQEGIFVQHRLVGTGNFRLWAILAHRIQQGQRGRQKVEDRKILES